MLNYLNIRSIIFVISNYYLKLQYAFIFPTIAFLSHTKRNTTPGKGRFISLAEHC